MDEFRIGLLGIGDKMMDSFEVVLDFMERGEPGGILEGSIEFLQVFAIFEMRARAYIAHTYISVCSWLL